MKVEKVETIKKQYPKLEEINKKEIKRKIGIIAVLGIVLRNKYVIAASASETAHKYYGPIPGDRVVVLEPEVTASEYTRLGYIAMIIVSIISLIIIKFKWKKYNLKQKKMAKMVLGILLEVTVILIIITMILKLKA